MYFRLFITLILLLNGTISSVCAQTNTPALYRGLNMSNWLGNAARQDMTEQDFQHISQAGFDHIRLPVNPELFGFHLDQKPDALDLTRIDAALALAAKYHLAVILDLHPSLAFMDALEKDQAAEDNIVALWDILARHYDENHYPPSQFAFALLNEPHYYHNENHYTDFANKMVAAIRQSSPQRLVIVGAPHGSSIEGLLSMQTLSDANIIYDFHFYEPYIITHQGIHRGFPGKMLRYFHDLPYPSSLVDHDAPDYAEQAPDQGQAEKELLDYVQDDWNADKIAQRIHGARDWAAAHKSHILCGEFGVLRNHIDTASRYRWITDTRKALDADNIGWDLWDYADLMGIVTLHGDVTAPDPVDGSIHLLNPAKGSRSFEPEVLTALGLTDRF